jgi:hypothetical protein
MQPGKYLFLPDTPGAMLQEPNKTTKARICSVGRTHYGRSSAVRASEDPIAGIGKESMQDHHDSSNHVSISGSTPFAGSVV